MNRPQTISDILKYHNWCIDDLYKKLQAISNGMIENITQLLANDKDLLKYLNRYPEPKKRHRNL